MLCNKILVAYDDSDLSKKSLERSIEIAETNSLIEIIVLHVMTIQSQEFLALEAYQEIHNQMSKYGQQILRQAEWKLASLPNKSQCLLVVGYPGTVILDYAKNNNCDLIIMGSRGLSGIKEFLGSVSHTVVQKSPVPVLIVK